MIAGIKLRVAAKKRAIEINDQTFGEGGGKLAKATA